MDAITLRNLPPDLARIIRRKAKQEGTSLNRTVINLLRERAIGSTKAARRARYRNLDAFAGSWTREQANEFDSRLQEQRKTDPELWK